MPMAAPMTAMPAMTTMAAPSYVPQAMPMATSMPMMTMPAALPATAMPATTMTAMPGTSVPMTSMAYPTTYYG
eukprot:2574040-Amphidinium_carterae.1